MVNLINKPVAILAVFSAQFLQSNMVNAQIMKIQYYWDGGCSSFAGDREVDDFESGNCQPWYISGTWSANIADCFDTFGLRGCQCTFYTTDDCSGSPYNTGFVPEGVNPNCVGNGGNGFRSFNCFNEVQAD
jgi:hypothetical protein